MSSSTKVDERKKYILILSKDQNICCLQKKMYSTNFTELDEKLWLSWHYNGSNSYLFVNGTEIHQFKAKGSDIVATPYVQETFQKSDLQIIWKKLDLTDMFLILVLIMMLLQLKVFKGKYLIHL